VKARRGEYRVGATTVTFDDYFAGKRYPIEMVHYIDNRAIDDEDTEETPLLVSAKNASH
jgi:hypothetical protein